MICEQDVCQLFQRQKLRKGTRPGHCVSLLSESLRGPAVPDLRSLELYEAHILLPLSRDSVTTGQITSSTRITSRDVVMMWCGPGPTSDGQHLKVPSSMFALYLQFLISSVCLFAYSVLMTFIILICPSWERAPPSTALPDTSSFLFKQEELLGKYFFIRIKGSG